jgi:inner membrane protein
MLGVTHAAIALATNKLFNFWEMRSYVNIAIVIFFALLPDIDTPGSELGKIFFPISRYIYQRFGHRNITHSLLFFFLVSSPFIFWPETCKLVLMSLGTHLLSDMLTYTGVPLFWPLKKNYVILGAPLLTGKWTEGLFVVVSLAIFVFLF